jgi:hypothetical protein
MPRILACDLDGIIFKFNDSYRREIQRMYKIDIGEETNEYPNVWYYERAVGVTKEQESAVWDYINSEYGSYHFWRYMPVYDGAKEFLKAAQQTFYDIYFVTARSGPKAQEATKQALWMLGIDNPKVIIAHDKVPHLLAIGATDFLDDRDKNFEDVLKWNAQPAMEASTCDAKLWMLDRPWNRHFQHPLVKRILSPMEIL